MKKVSIVLAMGLLAASSLTYAAKSDAGPNCKSLQGNWKNELGSTLTISAVDPDGKLDGSYTSPSGTAGNAAPLIGWTITEGDKNTITVVSFSVNWGQKYGSVTSWSGTCSTIGGKPVIKTIWNLVRSNSSFEWDHILTNSDTFSPK